MGLLERLSGVQDVARITIRFREDGNHRLVVERRPALPSDLQGSALDAALFLYYAVKSLHALGAGRAADELHQHIALSGVVLRRDMFEPFKSYIDVPGECFGRLQVDRSGALSINTTFRVPLADTNNYIIDSTLLMLSRAVETHATPALRSRLADAIEALGTYYRTTADPSSLQTLRHAAAAAFGAYQASGKPDERPGAVRRVFDGIRHLLDDETAQNGLYAPEAQRLIASGSSVDQLDGASGEFGRDPKNPIPVNGFIGELLYISQLATPKGSHMVGHRLGAIGSIDVYELVSFDGTRWDLLYFDMYHPRKSRRLPTGYQREVDPFVFATNQTLPDFPREIRQAVSHCTKGILGVPLVSPRFPGEASLGRFSRPAEHIKAVFALSSIGKEANSSELVRRGLAQLDVIQQRLVRPRWRFSERPVCESVYRDGDKHVVVGGAGQSGLHAIAHVRLRMLETTGRPISRMAVEAIESWVGVHDGFWPPEDEERFVMAAEAYMAKQMPVFQTTAVDVPVELESAFAELYPVPGTATSKPPRTPAGQVTGRNDADRTRPE